MMQLRTAIYQFMRLDMIFTFNFIRETISSNFRFLCY